MKDSHNLLFELVDKKLQSSALRIRKRILSEYCDLQRTPERRKALQPLIEQELDLLFHDILALLDNVGSQLPEGSVGWSIVSDRDCSDIRVQHPDGAAADYADMWLSYLDQKERLDRLRAAL